MADSHSTLTQATLHEFFHYNPETGDLTYKKKKNSASRVVIGSIAGGKDVNGYRNIRVDYKHYLAHRLVWMYIYGSFPKHTLDHINGVRDDNRIENLREATMAENLQNKSLDGKNTSGYTGVGKVAHNNMWQASISVNYRRTYLGLFSTKEEAYAVYCKAKAELHTFNPVVRT